MNTKLTSSEAPSIEEIVVLIRRIIAEIAAKPEKTKVDWRANGLATFNITIHPWQEDYGRILGSNREHLSALKTICKLVSDRHGKTFNLEMDRLPAGEAQKPLEFHPAEKWNRDNVQSILEGVFSFCVPPPYRILISDDINLQTAVDVVLSETEVSQATARWIHAKLQPLMTAIGKRNGRVFSFNIVQDDSLLGR